LTGVLFLNVLLNAVAVEGSSIRTSCGTSSVAITDHSNIGDIWQDNLN